MIGRSIKNKVFEIIEPDKGASRLSGVFDWFITTLILASVVSVFVITFDIPDWKSTRSRTRSTLLSVRGYWPRCEAEIIMV